MKPCKAERPVTCPFKKKGSSWATGEHSGVDFGTPTGDPVYAMWGGTITSKSWGSAYGTHIVIDHDTLPDGSPGLWAIYAHLQSKKVSSGQRVEAGQLIGYSNNTGNSSGPHLHVEVQPQSTWVQGSYRDPQPWIDAGGTVQDGNVYVSKLVYQQQDSDSVSRLQDVLNGIPLQGGANLQVTGDYLDATKAEVAKWQEQKATDRSVRDGSKMTAAQANQMFAGTGNTVIDDVTETPPPEVPDVPEPGWTDHRFGLWKWYSGKETSTMALDNDGDWHKILKAQPASGITQESSEHHFLYLRLELPSNRTADRTVESKFVRGDGDATAYHSPAWTADAKDSVAEFNAHFEDGSGLGGQWWVKVSGGDIDITTRYAKTHVMYQDAAEVASMAVRGSFGRIPLLGVMFLWLARRIKADPQGRQPLEVESDV